MRCIDESNAALIWRDNDGFSLIFWMTAKMMKTRQLKKNTFYKNFNQNCREMNKETPDECF